MSTLKVNTITNTSGNPDVVNMGKIVQVVQNVSNSVVSTSNSSSYVDCISSPTFSFTSGNKILVQCNLVVGVRYGYGAKFRLLTNAGEIAGALGDASGTSREAVTKGGYISNWDLELANVFINYLDTPSDSVNKYTVKWKSYGSQIIALNSSYQDGNNSGSTRSISSVTLYEVAA